RTLISAILAIFAGAPSVLAATFGINSGTLTATRLINFGVSSYDVRGLTVLLVSDPALLGAITITDSTLGTETNPFTSVLLPYGNFQLNGLNFSATEEAAIFVDFSTAQVVGNNVGLSALAFPFFPNPPNDSALA